MKITEIEYKVENTKVVENNLFANKIKKYPGKSLFLEYFIYNYKFIYNHN